MFFLSKTRWTYSFFHENEKKLSQYNEYKKEEGEKQQEETQEEYKNPEELELRQKQKGSSLIFNFFKFIQMWKNLKV